MMQKWRVPVAEDERLWTGGERNQSGLGEKLLSDKLSCGDIQFGHKCPVTWPAGGAAKVSL